MDESERLRIVPRLREFFRPSGGALYHLRALRRQRNWAPFSSHLARWVVDAITTWLAARWLDGWGAQPQLILIGPSAGYTLPSPWICRFSSILAYDLDPLAPWLFSRRHNLAQIEFKRQDLFWEKGELSMQALDEILIAHPRATVLFCNVLGQIPLEGHASEEQWNSFLTRLRSRLDGFQWASYHDLYSVTPLPLEQHDRVVLEFARTGDIRQALRHLPKKLEVTDHLMCGNWSAGLEKAWFPWSLSRNCLHVIEGIKNTF